jgi:hypothetical protein
MAKGLFDVECPCCQATLKVDPSPTRYFPQIPENGSDRGSGRCRCQTQGRGRAARRSFRKAGRSRKGSRRILNTKFDELLRQAKETRSDAPKRDIDLD